MALFPSPLERTAASALLLLSISKPRSPSSTSYSFGSDDDSIGLSDDSDSKSFSEEEDLSLFSTSSVSKCSSVISDGSSREYLARKKFGFNNYADPSREMKFKVARKRRSEVFWSISDDQKTALQLPASKSSRTEPTEDSCISTTTTAASSHSETSRTQLHRLVNHREKLKRIKPSSSSGSAHLRHQAEAILKMLSSGSSSEVRIRQLLGDSPDTSKALRMLLKKARIKRSGMGGRCDPYIYKIA